MDSQTASAESETPVSFDAADFPPLSKTAPSPASSLSSSSSSQQKPVQQTSEPAPAGGSSYLSKRSVPSPPPSESEYFRAVVEHVEAFARLRSASQAQVSSVDQLLALSLLIPRLSPFQLTFVSALANRYFDKVQYADGKKCDVLRAKASDTSYLNDLYTRAFQADQVPDVVCELAQLLPLAQLNSSQLHKQQQLPSSEIHSSPSNTSKPSIEQQQEQQPPDCAKLIHLYANMLMHCINRTDDVQLQHVIQALAVLQPDIRDHFLQNSAGFGAGQTAFLTNGDSGSETRNCNDSSRSAIFRSPSKIIPPELMIPILGGSSEPQQPLQKYSHPTLGVCASLPVSQLMMTPAPNVQRMMNNQPKPTPSPYYQHPNFGQSKEGNVSYSAPRHQAISRQVTMPEGSALASQHRNLQGVNSGSTPQSGVTSSPGCVFVMEGSGMRDVPIWLKTLRLHKYTPLFEKMSYEEMISLTDEWLEAHKVTKGATNKILQNIVKLRQRQSQLRHYEKELLQNSSVDVKAILDSLHQMMNTPIKRYAPSSEQSETTVKNEEETNSSTSSDPMQWILGEDVVPEGDLSGQMTRLIGRLMCFFLIKTASLSDPSLLIHFIKLVDKCAQHEAFTDKHRTLLSQTKQRCQSFVHSSRSHFGGGGNAGSMGGSNSPGSSLGYRKGRGMQSELRASPSVPINMGTGRANGIINEGSFFGTNNPSPPLRNYWLEQQQQGGALTSEVLSPQHTPLGPSYSLRSSSGMVSGRPPPHSMAPAPPSTSVPSVSNSSGQNTTSLVDHFMPLLPSAAPTSHGPPGFSTKQFRPSGPSLLAGKAPLGRTQSAPHTPPGGSLLMMSMASKPELGQPWGSPLAAQSGNGPSTSPSGPGNFGPPGSHIALSPQNSRQTTDSYEAEAFAQSQLNTLCQQMTDSCLNTPDFAEHDTSANSS